MPRRRSLLPDAQGVGSAAPNWPRSSVASLAGSERRGAADAPKPLLTREEVEALVKEVRESRRKLEAPATLTGLPAPDSHRRRPTGHAAATGYRVCRRRGRIRANQAERMDEQRRRTDPLPSTCSWFRRALHRAARRHSAGAASGTDDDAQEGVLKRLAALSRPLKYIGASSLRRLLSTAPTADADVSHTVSIHMLQRIGAGLHTSAAAFWEPATDGACQGANARARLSRARRVSILTARYAR